LGDLTVASDYSFEYDWWVLNAFAMDERQFREKYGVDTFLELTHIHVTDPIEDLTVVARFPDGFGSSPDFDLQNSLYPRVTHLDVDTADLQNINTKHNGKLEAELTQAGALRYIESLNIASLRVHRPVIGYSYGIVWRVPPVNGDEHAADEILDLLRQVKSSSPCRSFLKKLFVGFIAIVRKELIPAPAVELELSLMVYDPSQLLMKVVAVAIEAGSGVPELTLSGGLKIRYGEGVGGRAFKNNRPVLWQKRWERRGPDFYTPSPTGTAHEFLLAFPLRPKGTNFPYAVLCVGSATEYEFEPSQLERLATAHSALGALCFKELDKKRREMW
jgi:hypothetical protein